MTRIAIIDDDLDFQQMMMDVLAEHGWTAVPCTTLRATYTVLKSNPPDVILLDVRMERADSGWDVLTYLQLHPLLRGTPVIVCSAMADEMVTKREWLRDHGIAELLKPFDLDHLHRLIQTHLAPSKAALSVAG